MLFTNLDVKLINYGVIIPEFALIFNDTLEAHVLRRHTITDKPCQASDLSDFE